VSIDQYIPDKETTAQDRQSTLAASKPNSRSWSRSEGMSVRLRLLDRSSRLYWLPWVYNSDQRVTRVSGRIQVCRLCPLASEIIDDHLHDGRYLDRRSNTPALGHRARLEVKMVRPQGTLHGMRLSGSPNHRPHPPIAHFEASSHHLCSFTCAFRGSRCVISQFRI